MNVIADLRAAPTSATTLALAAATPTGMDLELRAARRNQVFASLTFNHHTVLYVNTVDASKVLVGHITDEVSCLFLGPVAIDITPVAADAINAWLGQQLKVISA